MKSNANIGMLNVFKGNFSVELDESAKIGNFNKFSCSSKAYYHDVLLKMHKGAHIINSHLFDMTDNITLGERSVIAGSGTQFWTHSYYLNKDDRDIRVDSPIEIGNRVYIGARSCILSGVRISDNIIVGAMTCVSKSLDKEGCYVSAGIRYIENKDSNRDFGIPCCDGRIYRTTIK